MRYRGFEITSCYDTGIERYNQQTGEDEICSGYFCEIYPAGDDQYANQLDAFCLAEGHEIADTTQGSLENGIIRYVDGHYGYLQEEKEEVRLAMANSRSFFLISYTFDGDSIFYAQLARQVYHIVNYLFQSAGIRITYENEEIRARLIETIYRLILPWLNTVI